jgi:hypothetical protein
MTGSDSSDDTVAAFMRAVRRIAAAHPTLAIVIVHHTGWQDGETKRARERGSSVWRGNCDITLLLERGEHDSDRGECRLTLTQLKGRDEEDATPLRLVRRRVELAETNQVGDPVTSCVIEPDLRTAEDREAERRLIEEATSRDMDLRVLRIIAKRPELATSQDTIRKALNVRKTVVSASTARLAQQGWITKTNQRTPYAITPAGETALAEVR